MRVLLKNIRVHFYVSLSFVIFYLWLGVNVYLEYSLTS